MLYCLHFCLQLTQPSVAYADPMVRSAGGRTYDISLGEGVSTKMPHTFSNIHWKENSLKQTSTNSSWKNDLPNESGSVISGGRQDIFNKTNVNQFVSHPVLHQFSSDDDFAPRALDKTQKTFLDSLSSAENLKSPIFSGKDSQVEGNLPNTSSERRFDLNMVHSCEISTHSMETEHTDQSMKSAQLQAVTQTDPLEEQKNFQSRLSQNSIRHHSDLPKDPNGSLSQHTMSTDSRSWGSRLSSDHTPISVDHRTLLADLDYSEMNDDLHRSQTVCVQTSGQIEDDVVEDDPLVARLNVDGKMIVDHHSSCKDQRSDASCSDEEVPLQYKKVELYDVSSQDAPVSVLTKQATLESQTGSAASGERFCHQLESDEEDKVASHGLISYSGNVYREWRPLVPDESPKTSALEHSQQVEHCINPKADDAPEGIIAGPVNELIIKGKGASKESDAASLDIRGEEESTGICRDESVKAGYWSFNGFQGVRAFHTASSFTQFTNHDPLQDETAFEGSKYNESEKCASEKLPQFPLPNMQSTLIDEDGNGTPGTSPPHVQSQFADLSQHSFTGSLNSRLSSEVGLGLHLKRDSTKIQSIPPSSHNTSEKIVAQQRSSVEPVNNRPAELKQYQPEFYSLVAHTSGGSHRNLELYGDNKSGSFPLQNDPVQLSKTVLSINVKSCDTHLRKQGTAAAAVSCEQERMLIDEETNVSTCTRNKWGEIFETYRSTNATSKSGAVYDVSKYEARTLRNDPSAELCDDDELQFNVKDSADEEDDDVDEKSGRSHSFDIPVMFVFSCALFCGVDDNDDTVRMLICLCIGLL